MPENGWSRTHRKMPFKRKMYTSLLCAGLDSRLDDQYSRSLGTDIGRAFVRGLAPGGLERKETKKHTGRAQGALKRFALPSMARGSGSALYTTGDS
jgi:hypothetical protein